MLPLIIDVNDPQQNGLIADFTSQGAATLPQWFNADTAVLLYVRPVTASTTETRLWDEDFTASDSCTLTIGNPDDRATGGTFTLTGALGTSAAMAYNISAAAMQTAISTVVTAGACTVTLISEGVYQIDWTANGAVSQLTSSATALTPSCTITANVVVAGSAGTKAQQVIEIKQSAIATVGISTAYTATAAAVTSITAQTNVKNQVTRVSFGEAYGGVMTVSLARNGITAEFQLSPTMTAEEIGKAFTAHPSVYYQNTTYANNISIQMEPTGFLIEFIGTLGGVGSSKTISSHTVDGAALTVCTSTAHGLVSGDSIIITDASGSTPTIVGTNTVTWVSADTFSIPVDVTVASQRSTTFYKSSYIPAITIVSSSSLVVPKGMTDELDLSTSTPLKQAFWATTEDSLTYTFQISRTRASGETRVIFSDSVTIKRSL